MKRYTFTLFLLLFSFLAAGAQTVITISDPSTWTYAQLSQYVGKTVQFNTPMYITNNYNGLTISPRRKFTPTNQAYPLSQEYNQLLSLNSTGTVSLNGVSGYHRMGEQILNLTAKVNSQSSLTFVSGTWSGNTRAELEKGYNYQEISLKGQPSIIVCTVNLEYYLVENLGTGYGPDNQSQHDKQRTKVSKALALINADIYGFVEIEQGQSALAELAADLTKNTGRHFTYINDGGSASSSYTKAGFVYCTETIEPYGNLRHNNKGVTNRKKTQAFVEKRTGEKFMLSVNHFKAKSGRGSGDNADQGDGQGSFNGDRIREAESILSNYNSDAYYFGDNDLLIMGDLNAYAMEDPITTLIEGGMIDLHRAFHADSSYSYTYHGAAGYLDHAIANQSLYPQITGMTAFHINSDESDDYTYDKSSDLSMFRCSDHDPIIVGLLLDSNATYVPEVTITDVYLAFHETTPYIYNAKGGYCILYRIDGTRVHEQDITTNEQPIHGLKPGLYIVNTYGQGKCHKTKIFIP